MRVDLAAEVSLDYTIIITIIFKIDIKPNCSNSTKNAL